MGRPKTPLVIIRTYAPDETAMLRALLILTGAPMEEVMSARADEEYLANVKAELRRAEESETQEDAGEGKKPAAKRKAKAKSAARRATKGGSKRGVG